MDKLQQEYNVDVIGMGTYIKRHWPKIWHRLGQNWDTEFPKVKTDFIFTHHIRRAGVRM